MGPDAASEHVSFENLAADGCPFQLQERKRVGYTFTFGMASFLPLGER